MPDAPEFNPEWEKEDHPIIRVSWSESQAYCTWMGGRLPTEAQWEYAARGGKDGLTYPWGNEINQNRASYDVMYAPKSTAPVTKLPPQNDWGLHDLAGNVWEWVADWYDENYYATQPSDTPVLDPRGPDEGEARVLRGGAWSDDPRLLRTAVRDGVYPDYGLDNIGFRCAIDRMPLGARPPKLKGI
jgi:sulfatase modifying factor 1